MRDSTNALMNANLGRYEIRERLGTGGMARVFKGYDRNLDRVVAIKVLHEHLADDPTFKERFEREAKFIASLNHPNIVQLFDYNTQSLDGQQIYYMVMSYISGPTLRDVLNSLAQSSRFLDHERVLNLMLNLTSALGYAHAQGMVHRDVKPANILLNERNEAVLTDFGIARLAQSSGLTQEGLTVGTPAYMSPEQATGDSVDARSDLYALGVILYEMLTGRPPFADDGSISVLLKHLNDPVPSLSQYAHLDNPYLDAVVSKSLAKDPADRYQSAYQFVEDLRAAFSGQMPEVTRTPEFTRAIPPISVTRGQQTAVDILGKPKPHPARTPLGVIAVGLAVICAVLFAGLWSQQNSRAAETASTTAPAQIAGQANSMTGSLYFDSTFDSEDPYISYWPQSVLPNLERSMNADGLYEIESTLSDSGIATIFQGADAYDDLALQMTAVLDSRSSNVSAYGLIFNYIDDANYNVFTVDGRGRFGLWAREDNRWRELRGLPEEWTADEAINTMGVMNTLTVSVMENSITAMVNGETVVSLMDETPREGAVGIYVATPPNGMANVKVDQFQVMNALPGLADSMTGG